MKDMLDILRNDLRSLDGWSVESGFIPGKTPDDIINIALMNNYGTRNIPRRPFMDNAQKKIQEVWPKYQKLMMTSKMSPKKIMQMFGEEVTGIIQDEIMNGNFVPNAESTVRRKGKNKPLIDTGRMLRSVTYEVRHG